eukprot:1693522-Pyramimonas_sp.AAC.2
MLDVDDTGLDVLEVPEAAVLCSDSTVQYSDSTVTVQCRMLRSHLGLDVDEVLEVPEAAVQ